MHMRVSEAVTAFLLSALLLGGWQWPMDPADITTGFGFAGSGGGMLRGVEFDAEGQDVVAAFDGTVVFRDTGTGDTGMSARAGGMVVLDHDNGWRTIYSGLAPEGLAAGEQVLSGRSIGTAAGRVRFEMYDRRRGLYVNPLLLLPLQDTESEAQIAGIRLVSVDDEEQESIVPSYNRVSHRSGDAEVRILIGDQAERSAATSLALTRAGVTFGQLHLERIEPGRQDRMVWDGGSRTAEELYDDEGWLRLATVSIPEEGSISFTARAGNARGEESTRVFTIDGISEGE